jgi:predicted RNA-binding protein with PIN domain
MRSQCVIMVLDARRHRHRAARRKPTLAQHIVVDGMNVVGSRPNGWWRDRDAAATTLALRLRQLAEATGLAVTLVLDGPARPSLMAVDCGSVHVLYGEPNVRNSADDRIVALVAGDANPSAITVVTSDRALVVRVRALRARVQGPSSFLHDLDALP